MKTMDITQGGRWRVVQYYPAQRKSLEVILNEQDKEGYDFVATVQDRFIDRPDLFSNLVFKRR